MEPHLSHSAHLIWDIDIFVSLFLKVLDPIHISTAASHSPYTFIYLDSKRYKGQCAKSEIIKQNNC